MTQEFGSPGRLVGVQTQTSHPSLGRPSPESRKRPTEVGANLLATVLQACVGALLSKQDSSGQG